jgi:pentatricopeptide repeat protein
VIDSRVIEQARKEGVEHSASAYSALMRACVRSHDVPMALKLFDQLLEKGMGCDYDPKAIKKERRDRFFALVAGQLDDERLRKDGVNILLALRAHGVQPPCSLQNRLIYAWDRKLPEQVLNHFTQLREQGCALSPAACRCLLADVIGSAGEVGRTRHGSVDAAISHIDATCDVEEETSAVKEPNILHTATERTPLRREASTFVPNSWEASTFVPNSNPFLPHSEMSTLCNWPPYALSYLQSETPQMGSQYAEYTTVMLRNLPNPFLREDLIKEMDAKGFAGLYNYVYIPADFATQQSRGYGFVNLISAAEAQRFMLAFDGFRDWPVPYKKICSVELAREQGLSANVRMYRNSAVMGNEVPERFRPVLFDGTERVPFPEHTGELPKVVRRARSPLLVRFAAAEGLAAELPGVSPGVPATFLGRLYDIGVPPHPHPLPPPPLPRLHPVPPRRVFGKSCAWLVAHCSKAERSVGPQSSTGMDL